MASRNDPINVPWSVREMVIGAAAVIGGLAGFLVLLKLFLSGADALPSELAVVLLTAASEGVLVLVVWRLAVRRHGVGWDVVGLRPSRTRRNLVLVVATLFLSLAITGGYAALVSHLEVGVLEPDPLPDEFWAGGGAHRMLIALAIGGWIPFVEEVFFRGYLFQGLASRYGGLWGAVISAALFAVAHLMIGSMIPIFMTGLLLAALYARTRSLWPPISVHAAQNLLALMVAGAA